MEPKSAAIYFSPVAIIQGAFLLYEEENNIYNLCQLDEKNKSAIVRKCKVNDSSINNSILCSKLQTSIYAPMVITILTNIPVSDKTLAVLGRLMSRIDLIRVPEVYGINQ